MQHILVIDDDPVLPLSTVDNSTNPCEGVFGWFSPHWTVQASPFILSAPALPLLSSSLMRPVSAHGASSRFIHAQQFPHGT
jgi:hypothetical protein